MHYKRIEAFCPYSNKYVGCCQIQGFGAVGGPPGQIMLDHEILPPPNWVHDKCYVPNNEHQFFFNNKGWTKAGKAICDSLDKLKLNYRILGLDSDDIKNVLWKDENQVVLPLPKAKLLYEKIQSPARQRLLLKRLKDLNNGCLLPYW